MFLLNIEGAFNSYKESHTKACVELEELDGMDDDEDMNEEKKY